jgi:hypothetical protein
MPAERTSLLLWLSHGNGFPEVLKLTANVDCHRGKTVSGRIISGKWLEVSFVKNVNLVVSGYCTGNFNQTKRTAEIYNE